MSKAPIDIILDQVDWQPIEREETPIDPGLPYATYSGTLNFAGLKLKCYVLNTGERVFDADDVAELFGGEIVDGQ